MKDGRRLGRPPDPYRPPDTPAGVVNVTDPDSRNVKTSRGWVQGYNAQAVVTAGQIVIAADVTVDSPDFGHFEPMITAGQGELTRLGITATPEVVLADAGYWHQVQMEAIVDRGMQVLIPPDARKRKGTRPGWDGGLYAFMRRVLATERGGGLYAKRQGMIEPVFADAKFNRRCERFQRRGRSAVRSEWRLITATHNLLKLWRHTPRSRYAPERGGPARPGVSVEAPRHPHRSSPRRRSRLSATASMERDSGSVTTALPGCKSGMPSGRAPPGVCTSFGQRRDRTHTRLRPPGGQARNCPSTWVRRLICNRRTSRAVRHELRTRCCRSVHRVLQLVMRAGQSEQLDPLRHALELVRPARLQVHAESEEQVPQRPRDQHLRRAGSVGHARGNVN